MLRLLRLTLRLRVAATLLAASVASSATSLPASSATSSPASSASPPPPPASAPLLGLWEVSMLAPSNATPFDAASLGTWLEVTPPGGGAAVSVVPFYTAAFVRSRNATSGEEILTPSWRHSSTM